MTKGDSDWHSFVPVFIFVSVPLITLHRGKNAPLCTDVLSSQQFLRVPLSFDTIMLNHGWQQLFNHSLL